MSDAFSRQRSLPEKDDKYFKDFTQNQEEEFDAALWDLKFQNLWSLIIASDSDFEAAAAARAAAAAPRGHECAAAAPKRRPRIVCTEVRNGGVEAVFAVTPPLRAARALLAAAASEVAAGHVLFVGQHCLAAANGTHHQTNHSFKPP